MEEKKQELVVLSPLETINQAVEKGLDLEKVEKALVIHERWQAMEAKKAYHKAMAAFKENPPKIDKDKKVGYDTSKGKVGYSHASLANAVDKITTELSKQGLSASWNTQQNGAVTVTCKITHILGHTEETTLTAPADTTGSKNVIQAIGSTITYLQRYTLLSALGLATYDQDDDGVASQTIDYIDDKQLGIMRDNLISLERNEIKFCAFLGVESLDKLPQADYQKAMAAIESFKKKKETKDELS